MLILGLGKMFTDRLISHGLFLNLSLKEYPKFSGLSVSIKLCGSRSGGSIFASSHICSYTSIIIDLMAEQHGQRPVRELLFRGQRELHAFLHKSFLFVNNRGSAVQWFCLIGTVYLHSVLNRSTGVTTLMLLGPGILLLENKRAS